MIIRQASVYLWSVISWMRRLILGMIILEDIFPIQRSGYPFKIYRFCHWPGSSYKNIQAAGCFHGRYDGNDVWIFRDHFSGGDLSAFQGYHRKNAQSISMTKILGYTNGEISRLYILSTSLVVVFCLLLSLPVERQIMKCYSERWCFPVFRDGSLCGWIPWSMWKWQRSESQLMG